MRKLFKLLLVSFALTLSAHANAAILSFNFSGKVNDSSPSLAPLFPLLTVVSGSFVVDDSLPDTYSAATAGRYENAFVSSSTTIGNTTFSSSGGWAQVVNQDGYDSFSVVVGPLYGVPGSVAAVGVPAGFTFKSLGFQESSNSDTLTNDSFPTAALIADGSAWSSRFATFLFTDENSLNQQLSFTLDSINVNDVPEPATITLLCLGLPGLWRLRKKTTASDCNLS